MPAPPLQPHAETLNWSKFIFPKSELFQTMYLLFQSKRNQNVGRPTPTWHSKWIIEANYTDIELKSVDLKSFLPSSVLPNTLDMCSLRWKKKKHTTLFNVVLACVIQVNKLSSWMAFFRKRSLHKLWKGFKVTLAYNNGNFLNPV